MQIFFKKSKKSCENAEKIKKIFEIPLDFKNKSSKVCLKGEKDPKS